MTNENLENIVTIRPWGTIVIENSIVCDGRNLLGAEDGKHISCYTHIHDDHICGLEDALGNTKSHVYSTYLTKDLSSALLMQDAEWIKYRTNYFGLKFNEPAYVEDFEISFLKAHHILGSGQLLVRKNKRSILYSSDFILEGTQIEKDVDFLILDSSHGKHSESQDFENVIDSKKNIIKKTKEIMEGPQKQLNIHASRGTLQLVMSWLRKEVDENIPFLAKTREVNIARIYSIYGHECGKIQDDNENFLKYFKNNHPYIRFLVGPSETDCEIVQPPIPSIRVGASSMTSLENDSNMFIVNLKEHATVSEVCEYVSRINPKHIILDNSSRVNNPENAKYLKEILIKNDFDVTLSPENHPNLEKI